MQAWKSGTLTAVIRYVEGDAADHLRLLPGRRESEENPAFDPA